MSVTLQMVTAPHLEEPSEPSSPEDNLSVIEQVSDEDAEDYQLLSQKTEFFDEPPITIEASAKSPSRFVNSKQADYKHFSKKPFKFKEDSSDEEQIDEVPSDAPSEF